MRFGNPITTLDATISGDVGITGGTLDTLGNITGVIKSGPNPTIISANEYLLNANVWQEIVPAPLGPLAIRMYGLLAQAVISSGSGLLLIGASPSPVTPLPISYIYASLFTSIAVPVPMIIPPAGIRLGGGFRIMAMANQTIAATVNVVYDIE